MERICPLPPPVCHMNLSLYLCIASRSIRGLARPIQYKFLKLWYLEMHESVRACTEMDKNLCYLKGNYPFSLKSTETALIYQLIFDKIEKFYYACASLKFDLKKSCQYSSQSNIFRLSITYFLCNLLRPPTDLPYFSRKMQKCTTHVQKMISCEIYIEIFLH